MLIVAFFLAEIVRRSAARSIFNSHSVNSLSFYFLFLDLSPKPDSPHMRVGAYALSLLTPSNSTSPSSCAEHALFIHFLFCDLAPLFKILWPELLQGPMNGCQEFARMLYFIICWYVSLILYLWNIFWFEGVLPSLLFFIFAFLEDFFSFRECSRAHCFARGSVLEYPEAVRACAMRRYPRKLGTFLFFIVFLHSSGCRPILYFSPFML
jgi:hypothetical protein